jgi:uncharacterized small protein (DUF1192 family)
MGETLHRTLVYFGLADEDEPERPAVTDETRVLIDALERRVAENSAEIAALRAEIAQLRARC